MSQTNVRFVDIRGVRYLRAEDVATYLREVAGSETTDTRNRLNEAARLLCGKALAFGSGTGVALVDGEGIAPPKTKGNDRDLHTDQD